MEVQNDQHEAMRGIREAGVPAGATFNAGDLGDPHLEGRDVVIESRTLRRAGSGCRGRPSGPYAFRDATSRCQ